GDALIRHDLEQRHVPKAAVAAALAGLAAESERAALVVERCGRTVQTARYLAARGFAEDEIARAVAWEADEGI
ncbi:MAG: RecX family transcriptional regulator, partial [Actinobacteria bacterium]|nr:RecX family transcriptional regulator [Actinomycetota bacterium]